MEINLEKKHLYLITAVLICIVGVGIVIANGSLPISELGHSIDEINWNEQIQQTVNIEQICLPDTNSGHCVTSWPSGTSLDLIAGTAINIDTSNRIEVLIPSFSSGFGGVYGIDCGTQKVSGITDGGTLTCADDLT